MSVARFGIAGAALKVDIVPAAVNGAAVEALRVARHRFTNAVLEARATRHVRTAGTSSFDGRAAERLARATQILRNGWRRHAFAPAIGIASSASWTIGIRGARANAKISQDTCRARAKEPVAW